MLHLGRRLFTRNRRRLTKLGLQDGQLAADGSAEEAVIAHLHKRMRENVLEEALKELFHRKRACFELAGIGSAILKGDLGSFHPAAII